jgi:hypothetical protein
MRKLRFVFCAIFIMACVTMNVTAQSSSTVTGTTAGAVIITPLALTQVSALHFGVMAVTDGIAGTCILSTDGTTRTGTGGVNLSTQTPAATVASYSVTGEADTPYAITVDNPITVTTLATGTGSTTMDIVPVAKAASNSSEGFAGTLNGTGGDTFVIGGTLSVATDQVAGTYAGTFDVTVAYN